MENVELTGKVPVDVELKLDEERLLAVLRKSETWNRVVSRRIELARAVERAAESQGREVGEVYDEFFRAREFEGAAAARKVLSDVLTD